MEQHKYGRDKRKHGRVGEVSLERRKHPRVTVKYKVTMAFKGGGKEGEATLLNLSEGGCAVQGTKPIPNQAMLLLRIYPPQWNLPIVVKAAVVRWVRGLDFGVEFLNIDTEVQAEVHRLLKELQAQDNMPG